MKHATPPKSVIFNGAPSQVINLPALLKGAVVIALIGAIHAATANQFPFDWRIAVVQAVLILGGVGLPFLKTAFTEIVIDTERITWRQGIVKRRVSSLELSRIRGVTTVQPWWQRLFGTGSVMIQTSEPAHPVRRLPGIRDAEALRVALNDAVLALREPA